MSKDFDDIYKIIDQSHKELCKQDYAISKDLNTIIKDQDKIIKDITEIKKQVRDISFKVDTMLEILNNFTIMLAEDDGDLDENYNIEDSNETWVPKDEYDHDQEDSEW